MYIKDTSSAINIYMKMKCVLNLLNETYSKDIVAMSDAFVKISFASKLEIRVTL